MSRLASSGLWPSCVQQQVFYAVSQRRDASHKFGKGRQRAQACLQRCDIRSQIIDLLIKSLHVAADRNYRCISIINPINEILRLIVQERINSNVRLFGFT